MASSSSSSMSKSNQHQGWTYDVFLSFAGKDTRKGYVGHLYQALDDKGIYTFKDDLQLRMGDSISNELLMSIEESKISVVVFSKKYADSSWCLNELVKIMDCRKLMHQMVIPVFYEVDPSHVRNQIGVFDEAFHEHERRYKNDLEKVQRWKKALFDAASICGCDVCVTANGNEAESIKEIVHQISSKCHRSSWAAKDLVGMMSRVRKMKSLLDTTANDVRIIGIWGMGGAGKTTLAWAVYDEISDEFHGKSYVENIREDSRKFGLHSLQGKILSDLLSEKDMKVSSVHEGIKLMDTRLRRKKILLVLDDVDDEKQLDALAASRDWFGKGSRIIITTRDRRCLDIAVVDEIYKSVMLDNAEAIKLFSYYAFHSSSPPKEFMELSNKVAKYANGLPLALKVVGAFLYKRGMDEWKSTLERLEVWPEDKVDGILKISFDGLRETEQKIFLDIACFFKGWDRHHATKILDSFHFYATAGMEVLIEKSLISVSRRGWLCMHDRIQDMGRHIVCKVSDNPGERSRLWLAEDVRHVLTSETGTDAIESIYLESTSQEKAISLGAITFKNMNELRFLWFEGNIKLDRKWISEGTLPCKLQWLTWDFYPFESLPECFEGEKLVGLEMRLSDMMIQLWKGTKNMVNLRYIDLSGSQKLTCTPDMTGTPNIKSLIFDECWALLEVHPSVGDLKHLVLLRLRGCFQLKSLPSRMRMESLETLILTDCCNLKKFPQISENMGRLSQLFLDGTSIEELPQSIGNLKGLLYMNLSWCRSLSLMDDFSALFSLEELDLSSSNFNRLPDSISQLPRLKILNVSDCYSLIALGELPFTIAKLEANSCWELTVSLDVKKYESLWHLSLCSTRFEIRDVFVKWLLQGGQLAANHRLSIYAGGDRIPEWFSQRNKGNSMNLPLPLNWCNGSILGFAFCAVLNLGGPEDIIIRFHMKEEKMRLDVGLNLPQARLLPLSNVHGEMKHVWVGFISIDLFKQLFPKLEQDDWAQFQGNLCVQFETTHLGDNIVGECASRAVYKEDMGTIKNSAGGLPNFNDIVYDDEEDVQVSRRLIFPYYGELDIAYVKQTSRVGAEILFHVRSGGPANAPSWDTRANRLNTGRMWRLYTNRLLNKSRDSSRITERLLNKSRLLFGMIGSTEESKTQLTAHYPTTNAPLDVALVKQTSRGGPEIYFHLFYPPLKSFLFFILFLLLLLLGLLG